MKYLVFTGMCFLLLACSPAEKPSKTVISKANTEKNKIQEFLKEKGVEDYKFKKGTYTLYYASHNFESGIDLSKAIVDDRIDSYRGIHSLVLKCKSRPYCGYSATFDSNRRSSVNDANQSYFDSYLVQFRSLNDVEEFKKLFQTADFSEYLTSHSVTEEFGDRSTYTARKWEEANAAELSRSYKQINRNENGSLAVVCGDNSYGTITKPTSSICISGNGHSDCKRESEWTITEAANQICGG